MQPMRHTVSHAESAHYSLAKAHALLDGRKPVFLWSLPLLCIGSAVVTLSQSVTGLLVGRFIQTLGASGGFAVGAAVIGDIYKVEERGAAMGVFYGVRVRDVFFSCCVLISGLNRPLC